MIIQRPQIRSEAGEIVVTAAVDSERRSPRQPDALWFGFPESVGGFVTDRADGFAAALLPLAMSRGESLTVHGELSYRLARGLREYQGLQSTWKPKRFQPVTITAEALCNRDPAEGTGAVGSAFSGGIDSFHTLQSHIGESEPYAPYRISHCLMINGFDPDADLDNTGSFAAIQRIYEPLMERLGIQLVVVRTNLLQFLGLDIQKQSFGAFVTAPALVLGRMFSSFYVPSSYNYTQLHRFHDGSHPAFDHLVATESLETIHDGGHLTRVEKTLDVANWPETYDLLRVCFKPTGVQEGLNAIANCCSCEKCLRTMMTLDIAGELEKYRCFPNPLSHSDIRRSDYGYPGTRVFAEEIIDFAKKGGRPDIVRDLRWAIVNSILYRRRLRSVMFASLRLEERSRPYAAVMAPAKRLIRRAGIGRGWLY